MNLKTHFETGIGLSLLLGGMAIQKIDVMNVSPASKIGIMGAIIVGVTAGSVYDDIDRDGSNLNAENVDMHWENNFDHRGIIHTLINVIGVALPFLLITWVLNKLTTVDTMWVGVLGLSMGVGCIWHMLLDTLTPKGIMWLYPITVHRFRIPIIKTNGTERIFRILVTGAMLYKAVYYWSLYL